MASKPPPAVVSVDQELVLLSGFVTPSKIAVGQKARQPTESAGSRDRQSATKTCIVCGFLVASNSTRSHFVACVKVNGNPIGAQWWHNFVNTPGSAERDESYHR